MNRIQNIFFHCRPKNTFLIFSLFLFSCIHSQPNQNSLANNQEKQQLAQTKKTKENPKTTAVEDPMKDFEQLLPRGRIAAINEPKFVIANEANIAPESWVLGVILKGNIRAYSLDLLNSHEVVNDEIEGVQLAAVW